RLGESRLDRDNSWPRRPRGGSLACLWKGGRRLGAQQRSVELSRCQLDRIKHKFGLACRGGPGIRIQIALDDQARVRLSCTVTLDVAHTSPDTVEPRPSNGQVRRELQVRERPS